MSKVKTGGSSQVVAQRAIHLINFSESATNRDAEILHPTRMRRCSLFLNSESRSALQLVADFGFACLTISFFIGGMSFALSLGNRSAGCISDFCGVIIFFLAVCLRLSVCLFSISFFHGFFLRQWIPQWSHSLCCSCTRSYRRGS